LTWKLTYNDLENNLIVTNSKYSDYSNGIYLRQKGGGKVNFRGLECFNFKPERGCVGKEKEMMLNNTFSLELKSLLVRHQSYSLQLIVKNLHVKKSERVFVFIYV